MHVWILYRKSFSSELKCSPLLWGHLGHGLINAAPFIFLLTYDLIWGSFYIHQIFSHRSIKYKKKVIVKNYGCYIKGHNDTMKLIFFFTLIYEIRKTFNLSFEYSSNHVPSDPICCRSNFPMLYMVDIFGFCFLWAWFKGLSWPNPIVIPPLNEINLSANTKKFLSSSPDTDH